MIREINENTTYITLARINGLEIIRVWGQRPREWTPYIEWRPPWPYAVTEDGQWISPCETLSDAWRATLSPLKQAYTFTMCRAAEAEYEAMEREER